MSMKRIYNMLRHPLLLFCLMCCLVPQWLGAQTNRLTVGSVEAVQGDTVSLPVSLDNESAVTGGQFELLLPKGVTVDGVKLDGARSAGHTLQYRQKSDGSLTILFYASPAAPLKGSSGELCSVSLVVSTACPAGTHAVKVGSARLASDATTAIPMSEPVAGSMAVKALYLPDSPDFTVADIRSAADRAMPGDTIHVAWRISNDGKTAATGGWSERVSLVSETGTAITLGTFYHETDGLAVGGAVLRGADVVLPALPGIDGKCKISVTVVPYSHSGEAPEYRNNNTSETSGYVVDVGKKLYMTLPEGALEEGSATAVRCRLSRSGNWTEGETFVLEKTRGDARLEVPATVTVPRGQSGAYFYINIADNDVLDGDGTFEMAASGNGYDAVSGVVTVEDNEYPQLTVAPSKADVTEGEMFSLTVGLQRASVSPVDVTVSTDFPKRFSFPASVTVPAGETSATVEVKAIDNDDVELQESVAFRVSASGYTGGECIVLLDDNDLPAIDLELSPSTVSESAGPAAILATLRRLTNTDRKVTIQLSDDSDGDICYSRKSFVLDSGVDEVQFALGVVDNANVDGDRTVNITAAVYVASCSCSASGSSAGAVTKAVEITDNDGPSLGVTSSKPTLLEGGEVVLTVTRNTSTDTALEVSIGSDGDEGLSYEHNVTIPKGAESVDVVVRALPNTLSGDSRTIVFTIESGGFSKGTCWVMLTDQTLPDAQISGIGVSSAEVQVGGTVDVSLTLENAGAAELPDATRVDLYVSNSSAPVAVLYLKEALPAGGRTELAKTISMPAAIGSYEIYAVVNDDKTVKELLYANNTSGRVRVKTVAPFSATVSTDKSVYQPGEEMRITGRIAGAVTDSSKVEVYVINAGLRRIIEATADAGGGFSAVYKPYRSQTGHFSIGACYPGENLRDEMASADIYGFRRASASVITCEAITGERYDKSVSFVNSGVLPLTGVRATVLSKPEHCTVDVVCSDRMDGGKGMDMLCSILSETASPGNGWEEIKIMVETAEGPSVETTLFYYCRNAKGQLHTNVSRIKTTMVKGASRDYPITITNIGKGETGKITLALPEWMGTATPQEMASLAYGESVTAILRFTPTEAMPLNVPVTGRIGINCENGNGLALDYSIEPVSESTGTLVVDVCDEYTYYTAQAPHVSGAQVLVKHPTTGAVIAQGLTGGDGLYTVTLPEGYYSVSVTADRHDSYRNNILVDPGTVTKEVVNLSFKAITVDWKVEETEVEDEYNIVTEVEYETNVPEPVVQMSVPDRIAADELQPGESLMFYAVLTNKGLITAQDVELRLPTGLSNLTFEAMEYNDGPLSLAPQQSVLIPVKVTKISDSVEKVIRRAEGKRKAPCLAMIETMYFWDCGFDRKWHCYGRPVQVGVCGADFYNNVYNHGGSGGENPPGGPGNHPGGPNSPRPDKDPDEENEGPEYIGDDEDNKNPVKRESKGCEPCQQGLAVAGLKCAGRFLGVPFDKVLMPYGSAKKAGEKASGTNGNTISSYSLVEMQASKFDESCDSKASFEDVYKSYSAATKAVDKVFDTAVVQQTGDLVTASDFSDGVKAGIGMIDLIDMVSNVSACANDFAHACDHLLNGSEIEFKPRRNGQSGSKDYIKSVMKELDVVHTRLEAFANINDVIWGSEKEWDDVSFYEMCVLIDSVDYKSSDFEDVAKYKPQALSMEMYRQFFERRKQYLLHGLPDSVAIALESNIRTMKDTRSHFDDMGYFLPSDYTEEHVKGMMDLLDEGQKSVCATISLQLSQTMTMTRQAFRGTLTVFNGNEEKAMENVRLNIDVRDDEGTLATSHEFQINMESLKGFAGELDMAGRWSLAAGETGTATVVFIPTKYAALETDREYSFGGSLTYTDPFTGMEVTRDLYPVTLTVKPSPNIDLTYFMQRDIYGDNPLTPDVIEPCEPAEFALLVSNKGNGDATNVRMVTEQPKIVDNEKGLLIDFKLLSSQLNGGDKTLALGGSVTTEFGTIPAQSTVYAQWWLQSSLLGHFTDYDVKATHVTSYGNEDLSLLDNVTIHELTHGFTVDGGVSPVVRGFLVNDIADSGDTPDMVYFTDGSKEESVAEASSVEMTRRSDTEYAVTITPSAAGWNYGSSADLTAGRQKLVSVVRQSDGAAVPADNFWLTAYTLRAGKDPVGECRLHAVAELSGSETYLLTFEPVPEKELVVEAFTGVPAEGQVLTSRLASVGVRFSKAIDAATFTTDDVGLRCQGVAVDISRMEITRVSDTEFTLGLDSVALADGYYVLTVQTAGITASDGFAGTAGASASWIQFADGLVSLKVAASPEEGGTVSPATGPVAYDTTVTLTATAADGYDFAGWKNGDARVSDEPSFDYTVKSDETFTALFTIRHLNVEILYDTDCGEVDAASGIYAYGTVLDLHAVASDGYRFDGWMSGESLLSSEPSYSLKVEEDIAVTAKFSRITSGGDVEYILGDVNEDGRLNVNDIVVLSKYISDGDSTQIQILKADLTGDGRITVADVVELARRIATQ